MTFGPCSSLERISVSCFEGTGVDEMTIPDSVRELCDGCFKWCSCLCRVIFGTSSSLERIGSEAFGCMNERRNTPVCGIVEISIPDSVRELGDRCFAACCKLRSVTFGPSSSLRRIGVEAFAAPISFFHDSECEIVEVSIPDRVCELCDRCFRLCSSLRRVTFGPSSSLERIGDSCFHWTGVDEMSIPDSVLELGSQCFAKCSNLRRVTFGSSSSLARIGVSCFEGTGVDEMSIPDSVLDLGSRCFAQCCNLCRVTFGSSSSLERIGYSCFDGTQVDQVDIPSHVPWQIGDRG